MANTTPIIPPGSPLQRTQPNRNSKLVVTVFAVLAVHVFVLSGLLIQGCKREDKNFSPQDSVADLAPARNTPAAPINPTEDLPKPPATGTVAVPTNTPPPATPLVTNPAPARVASLPAPTINRTRVQTGGTNGTYSVKAGDTLTKIAKAHGVTVRALRAANNLKTDRIVVGQKLKLHTEKSASETPSPTPLPAPPLDDATSSPR